MEVHGIQAKTEVKHILTCSCSTHCFCSTQSVTGRRRTRACRYRDGVATSTANVPQRNFEPNAWPTAQEQANGVHPCRCKNKSRGQNGSRPGHYIFSRSRTFGPDKFGQPWPRTDDNVVGMRHHAASRRSSAGNKFCIYLKRKQIPRNISM